MKRTLLLVLSLLLIVGVALGLAGCKPKNEEPPVVKSYTLDSSAFKPTAVFGEKLSLNGLKLVEAGGETVTVTDSMVTGVDTSSAGEKTLTVSYNDQTFEVKYTVKFRVVFVVNGVESEQLVASSGEIKVPETPVITGQQFEAWSVEIPTTLTSNLRIDAIYKTLDGSRQDVYTWTGTGLINLSGYANEGATINVSITDADGNEIVADHKSYYSSYTATNKSMTNIYLAGSENGSTFDQNYFLDNITFIRTEDASILPAV